MSELHSYEVIREEESTGLKISKFKVESGWLYVFSYPLGLQVQFVPNPPEKVNEG